MSTYYGRGRAPERACRRIESWPQQDRRLWQAALQPGDLIDAGGERARYRPISNRKVERGYGRWLTYLDTSTMLDPGIMPADRITPASVVGYVEALRRLGNGSQTILARLQELFEAALVMAPAGDWSWIRRIAARIRARHVPVRNKTAKLVGADDLLALGMRLMAEAETATTPRLGALAFRDGLLIAFLALCPLRLKNAAALALERHVVRQAAAWWIAIPAAETKTEAPIEQPWPECLLAALEDYLARWRPLLARMTHRWTRPVGNALWVSSSGSPMTMQAIYDRVIARTQAAFGKPINPHAFRDIAATTIADVDPEHVRIAAQILGHRSFATTERHYIHAKTMAATRRHQQHILRLRHADEG
jgi:integrase/recombinase XerD